MSSMCRRHTPTKRVQTAKMKCCGFEVVSRLYTLLDFSSFFWSWGFHASRRRLFLVRPLVVPSLFPDVDRRAFMGVVMTR